MDRIAEFIVSMPNNNIIKMPSFTISLNSAASSRNLFKVRLLDLKLDGSTNSEELFENLEHFSLNVFTDDQKFKIVGTYRQFGQAGFVPTAAYHVGSNAGVSFDNFFKLKYSVC